MIKSAKKGPPKGRGQAQARVYLEMVRNLLAVGFVLTRVVKYQNQDPIWVPGSVKVSAFHAEGATEVATTKVNLKKRLKSPLRR